MTVLYLLSAHSHVRKEASRLLVEKDGETAARLPLRSLSAVVIGPAAEISTSAVFACLQGKNPLFFVDRSGSCLGQLTAETTSLQMLQRQMLCTQDSVLRLKLSRQLIAEKCTNQYKLLKSYEKSVSSSRLIGILAAIKALLRKIPAAASENELRGLEGSIARTYFQGFPLLLDQRTWHWAGRERHPAQDPPNALLNLGYAFLEREVRLALIAQGLDLRIGILHSSNGRKDSLAYDLMELFRQPVIDRFVLSLLRRRTLKPQDFSLTAKDGCRLKDNGFRLWVERYEQYMEKTYQEYEGRSPRSQIRQKTAAFTGLLPLLHA